MPAQNGFEIARQQALAQLKTIDLRQCSADLGLPPPQGDRLQFKAFDLDLVLNLTDLTLTQVNAPEPVKIRDEILIYHYLLSTPPVRVTGDWITFRELPGGLFYWNAYVAQTTHRLIQAIQNDLARLTQNVAKFKARALTRGDWGYQIKVIGNIDLMVIYYLGDTELSPAVTILYDRGIKSVFPTEDVVVLTRRICSVLGR